MIRGAIFDVDGTLLDSMHLWDTIGETYLRSIGYEPRENLNETFKNMSLYQAACYYQSEYGVTLSTEEIIAGVNDRIGQFYRERAGLKPGVAGFLRQLREKGVKMCIATATDRPLVEAALERCGVLAYFSDIFTCFSVGHGKDEPVIYRTALEHLQTARAKTIVFEDALYAARTARRDNFVTAAVYDAYEKRQAELRAAADLYITDFTDWKSFWDFASQL